jgi:hypothetical protein
MTDDWNEQQEAALVDVRARRHQIVVEARNLSRGSLT